MIFARIEYSYERTQAHISLCLNGGSAHYGWLSKSWKVKKSDRDKMLTVDSTPLYAFYPLAPYRMKMVLPRAKLIIVVRDPTER